MKTDIPKDFLDQYEDERQHLRGDPGPGDGLITGSGLSQLAARTRESRQDYQGRRSNVRQNCGRTPKRQVCRMRTSSPAWRTYWECGSSAIIFSDITPIVEMVSQETALILKVRQVKDMTGSPH